VRVLVIPEDSRRDKDLLKPLVEAMMAAVGRPRAKVRVCEKPVLGGVAEALKLERLREIIDLWGGYTDLFLLIVDRDGKDGKIVPASGEQPARKNEDRRAVITHLEEQCAALLPEGKGLIGENAIEEVEVWVLAGHELPAEWSIRAIRAERDPKEAFFVPFLARRGLTDDAAGRALVAVEAARNFQRICDRCPEDMKRLTERVRARVGA
jgi:hypothetical protein